jgi:class 3 adenylate cyclase
MPTVETVSILMTDLVGSTDLASRMGHQAVEELRREHFLLLRAAVEDAGGREVKSRGDGLMVAFQSAAAAVACAVSIQQRSERRNRGAAEQLSVRIGIALGDATVEANDYYGMSVVEAARLCDGSDGGQIVTTELVRAIAGRHGHSFSEVGTLRLKGIREPVKAFEVAWKPLPAEREGGPLPRRLQSVPVQGYVGRRAERGRLQALADEAREGQLRIALISGEPGVGKTRLATLTALDAHAAGAIVLFGRCQEDVRIPYQPWSEALRHYVGHAPLDLLARHVRRSGGEVARLAPELSRRLPDSPPPRETDPETERYLLWVAVAGLLEEASRDRLAVLVLDDLHCADHPTLALLKQLAFSDAKLGLLLLGTYRQTELTRGDPLSELLADLRPEDSVERVALEGLAEDEVVAFMEAAAGHEMDGSGVALARELTQETDGNPYFVGELLRHLDESGAIRQQESGRWTLSGQVAELGLPQSVREVIGRRVERLGDDAARVLDVAAVIGLEFDLKLLSLVADRGEDDLLEILERAVEASLLQESGQVVGHFSFAHALVNHTLYQGLSATRRARLHRRTAEALEDLCEGKPGERVGELAHHWSRATAPAEGGKVLEYCRRAGERALVDLAPGEARLWFAQGLELLEQQPRPQMADRCELLIGLGDAQRQVGDAAFRETLLEAGRLAGELGDGERLARAAIANTREFVSVIGEVDEERVAKLEQALEFADEASTRAALLSLVAAELLFGANLERRLALSNEAVRLARETGDEKTLTWVLARRFIAAAAPETLDELLADTDELTRLADRLGDPLLQFWAAVWRACAAMQAADADELHRCVAREQELADLTGQPLLRWASLFGRVWQALLNGRIDDAEELAERAAEVGTEAGQPDVLPIYVGQLMLVRYEQGRLDELVDLMSLAAEENPRIPFFTGGLALAYCELDRLDEAQQLMEPFRETRFAALPRDIATLVTLATFSEAAAQLQDREAAAALYEQLAPWSGQVTINGVTSWGAVDLYLGRLADTLDSRDRAERHLAAAEELHERIGAPTWLARTRYARAHLLLRGDGPGDARRAREAAGRAFATARELGLGRLERRALAAVEAVEAG